MSITAGVANTTPRRTRYIILDRKKKPMRREEKNYETRRYRFTFEWRGVTDVEGDLRDGSPKMSNSL